MSRHVEDIGNLSWSKDPETQKNAAMNLLAADDWDCENCIIGTEKDVWENLVAVIEKTGRGTKKNAVQGPALSPARFELAGSAARAGNCQRHEQR